MQHLNVLVAPIVPLACLVLVLWLDRLEESLNAPRRARQTVPEPAADPVPVTPVAAPGASPTLAMAGLDGAAAD